MRCREQSLGSIPATTTYDGAAMASHCTHETIKNYHSYRAML
ncbi:hypothetical protein CHELA1G11_21165 [Hyphomicrobiales bacterium]|nr:hypothetical protein CHELA1G11_21165 [Hyphomicrobiales bacterium]